MSRIGRTPIPLSSGIKVEITDRVISVSGNKGKQEQQIPDGIEVEISDTEIKVVDKSGTTRSKALHGLGRSLINNMVIGVSSGFRKDLEIRGVGYRAQVSGKKHVLNLGYSHPVEYSIPDELTVAVVENTKISIEGIDKQRVGQVAAEIREYRKPEPYKGKGVRYVDEVVMIKEGKSV